MSERRDHSPEDAHGHDDASGHDMAGPAVHDDVTTERRYVSEDVAVADDTPYAVRDYSLSGRINTVLFAVLVALESLLALRFSLIAFGANRDSGFVEFILDVSRPFVRPFENAFANRTWDEGIIEVNTLLAMGVYALIFAIIAMLLSAILPRMTGYDRHERVESRSVTHQGGHR